MKTFVSKQISYSEPEKILNKNPLSPEMVTKILGYKGISVIAIDNTKNQVIKNLTISKITDSSYEKTYDGIEFLDRSTRAEAIEQTGESILELDLLARNQGIVNTTGNTTEHTEGTSSAHSEGTSTAHSEGTLSAHMEGSSEVTTTGNVVTKEMSLIRSIQDTSFGSYDNTDGSYNYTIKNIDVTLPPVDAQLNERLIGADIAEGELEFSQLIPMDSLLESESSGTTTQDTTGTSESDSTGTSESDSTGTSTSDTTGSLTSESIVDINSVGTIKGVLSNLKSRTPAKNIFLYNAFNFNYSQKSIETIISCKIFFVSKGFLYELLKSNSSPININNSDRNINDLSDENPLKQFTNRKEDYRISFDESISFDINNEYFSYVTTISTSDISSYNYEIPVNSNYDYVLLIPEASPKSFNQKKPKLEVFYQKLLSDTLSSEIPPTEEGNFVYPSGEDLPQNVGDYAALFNHLNKNGVEFFVNKYSEFVSNFYAYNSVNEDTEETKLYTLKNIHATINFNLEEAA